MRWPRRRRRPEPQPTPTVVGRTDPPAVDDRPRLRPDALRADWARLPPIGTVSSDRAPETFHGERFGRSVAGARAMTPTRHRRTSSASAPSGLLLDITKVETIEAPPPDAAPPEPPPTVEPLHTPTIVHRPRRIEAVERVEPLAWSDTEVPFRPVEAGDGPAPSDAPSDVPAPMSWTPTGGFRSGEPSSSGSRLRLVGRRGHDDEAIASARDGQDADGEIDDVDAEPGPPAAGEPTVRYLPEPGARVVEQPSAEVVRVVERATGVEIGDAVIDRSPSVSLRAAEMGAVAFTESGVVHLPEELGPQDEPRTRAIVAHELTHVAQRRKLGSATPPESTPDGEALEAEAHAVQRSVWSGEPVTPAFVRSSTSVPDAPPAGVHRLRSDEDPYEWQRRGPAPQRESLAGAIGSFFGIDVGDDDEDDPEHRAAVETWAREFEEEHADDLQHRRDERYEEIYREARRAALIESRRREEPLEPFDHDDILQLRTRLDDEMPFEFGPPIGIDPYPGTLPEDDDEAADAASARRPGTPTPRGERPSRQLRSTSSTPPEIGRRAAGARGSSARHPRRRPGGASGGEPDYDWQERGPSGSDMASSALSSVFGDGLGGFLGGLLGDEEADEAERRAEEEEARDDLMDRRHRHERELRHRRIVQVRTQHIREGGAPEDPVTLVEDEITEIREQVDRDMPLEFVLPEYLPTDQDASLRDGEYGPLLDPETFEELEEEDEEEAGESAADRRLTAADTDTAVDRPGAAATAAGAAATTRGESAIETPVGGAVERPEGPEPAADAAGEAGEDDLAAGRLFAAASETDLDALARRLYGRLRGRLRQELLIDRERAGALADMR